MRFRFHPDALAEFQQAATYYEDQETGLGEQFIEIIDSAVANAIQNLLSYSQKTRIIF